MDEHISRRSKLIRDVVARFNSTPYIKDHIIGDHRSESDFDKSFSYPEHIKSTKLDMGAFRAELIENETCTTDYALLHLHGGGYVGAFKTNYRRMAGYYSEVSGGAPVLTPDYRVAPENIFPAALYDAVVSYDYLRGQGYSGDRIVLCGDSAGGGLAMALCRYLLDRDRQIPAGIVAMSPWTDLTASGASYRDNYDVDPVFGNSGDDLIFKNPYPGSTDRKHPYISPAYADFGGFPPMLIQVGTHEMLLDDSRTVRDAAREAGVLLRYTEYPGMFHVFQVAGTIMEESKKAWAEVGTFFKEIKRREKHDLSRENMIEREEEKNDLQ